MPISTLSTSAKELGSMAIKVTVGNTEIPPRPVTPLSLNWTWTDRSGTVINDRQAVEVPEAELSGVVVIKLFGDDLVVPFGAKATRLLTVQGTYLDSDGVIMPFSDGIYVVVDDLAGAQSEAPAD